MYKLTVKLKQHTPMIHFQWDQEGATLRASEVKPKLDKFIIQHAFQDEFDNCKTYLIGYKAEKEDDLKERFETKGYRALDYRLKIIPLGEKEIIDGGNTLKMYFGNMGTNHSSKYGVIYNDGIVLQFESWCQELINYFKCYLSDFLSKTNFGTRQSKGYGSFYIDFADSLYKEPQLKYHFTVSGDLSNLFLVLNDFYSVLRSGINNNGLYIKSALFKYAKDVMNLQWDEKTIKQHFLSEDQKDEELNKHPDSEAIFYTTEQKYLIKKLLGFSTSEKWGSYFFYVGRENDEIKRFQSPIIFKPIQKDKKYIVYFDAFEIPDEIKGKTFSISRSGQQNRFTITITSLFKIHDYLDYVFRKINLKDLYDENITDNGDVRNRFLILDRIFNEVKDNL